MKKLCVLVCGTFLISGGALASTEILVKFKQAGTAASLVRSKKLNGFASSLAVSQLQLQAVRQFVPKDGRYVKLTIANEHEAKALLKELRARKDVLSAGLNKQYQLTQASGKNCCTSEALATDPLFSQQWALRNMGVGGKLGADIDIARAWKIQTGSKNVVVAIIDSGMDLGNPDLTGNVWRNSRESVDGVDNDGNGYNDDIYGWNFLNNDGNVQDERSHGSHVAGIIGAVGNDGRGIAGINWQVSLMPLKVFGATGGAYEEHIVQALRYAQANGAHIINASFAYSTKGVIEPGEYTVLRDAINELQSSGILFVSSAGNDGLSLDTTPAYPANYALSHQITVASTDSHDVISGFSNYSATFADIAAPGSAILSALLGNDYKVQDGTSMAAPMVSGVAALLKAENPTWQATQIKEAILRGRDYVPSLATKVKTQGRLNAYNSLRGIYRTAPPEPTNWVRQSLPEVIETLHPVPFAYEKAFEVYGPVDAKAMRIIFDQIEDSCRYCTVEIYDKTGTMVVSTSQIPGVRYNETSRYVFGNYMKIVYKTVLTPGAYGFKASYFEYSR
ncbi:S8 family serine peptidase [Bdellovibrio sp.]|uniref:S8 family serine peptidase n=1 Tax=Bdellovibrio sp. TaxID=28201 RepID=UPI0039E282E5